MHLTFTLYREIFQEIYEEKNKKAPLPAERQVREAKSLDIRYVTSLYFLTFKLAVI
jgi:hypothetical protein